MSVFAVFLCVHLAHPNPKTAAIDAPCTPQRERYADLAACRAYLDQNKAAYLRHDDQGRYYIPDSNPAGGVVAWNECRPVDSPAPRN